MLVFALGYVISQLHPLILKLFRRHDTLLAVKHLTLRGEENQGWDNPYLVFFAVVHVLHKVDGVYHNAGVLFLESFQDSRHLDARWSAWGCEIQELGQERLRLDAFFGYGCGVDDFVIFQIQSAADDENHSEQCYDLSYVHSYRLLVEISLEV